MRCCPTIATALLLSLADWVAHSTGQGLLPLQSSTVAASSTVDHLQRLYSGSQAFKRSHRQHPKTACSKANRASLCAAAATDAVDKYAVLMLAASPQVYSSVSNSGVQLVAAAQDQGPCGTCAAFAVAAAAETAMASALQVDVQQCSISVQALYFCPPGRPTRSCTAGWTLPGALEQLQQRGPSLPTAACLPYRPDFRQELSVRQLCSGSCSSPSQHASKGQFTARQITSIWEAQRHIRQYGAVVARFEVMSDFEAFFAEKRNAQAVYRPGAGARPELAHAIVLVGYNNQQQYWLAKNSWGRTWGDGGLFKVAYGVSSVLTPFSGEAYGVMWTPHSTPAALQLPVTPGPRPGCYLYKARPADYLSKVAWLAGIPLERFMLDNTDRVKDLDAPLQGKQLLLCNPQQGKIKTPGSNPTPTPRPGPTPAPGDPQLESLLRVKAAVDSAGVLREWTKANGASGGYCKWKGVLCAPGTSYVFYIDLWGDVQGLKGTLPPAAAFAGLAGLTDIAIIFQPGITGTLPTDWARMTQLQDVKLSSNSLTGSIPSSWSGLSKLTTLFLSNNKLSGRIPDSFGALTSLEFLTLSGNALTGTIPDLSRLSKLWHLSLDENKLSGRIPDSLGALTSLKTLRLADNALSGTIPDLSRLSMLKEVTLQLNPLLQGCLPASWRQQLEDPLLRSLVYDSTNIQDGTNIQGFC